MAAAQRGLGKGLDALFQSGGEKASEGDIKHLPVERIEPNQFQPRRHFSEDSLQELALSIRSQGVLQPILVRVHAAEDERTAQKRYELIAGERRLRAAKLCGLKTIPAIVRAMSDDQSLILAIIENLQREDLNPLDEAAGLANLQERMNANQDDLARAVGKSRSAVANALRLLQLPEGVQESLRQGRLSAGHARSLLGVEDSALQEALHQQILEQQLSVRQVEQITAYIREHGELPESELPAKRKSTAVAPRPTPALLPAFENLQSRLNTQLPVAVRLQGSPEKGKMVLSFASEKELQEILSRLGIEAEA